MASCRSGTKKDLTARTPAAYSWTRFAIEEFSRDRTWHRMSSSRYDNLSLLPTMRAFGTRALLSP